MQVGALLRTLGLLGTVTLVAGCTTLTDSDPTPPAAPTETSGPGIVATPAATPEIPSLDPEDGEDLLLTMAGKGGSFGSSVKLAVAKTYVSWTCVGSGPITVSLGKENSYTGRCSDSGDVKHVRHEFMNGVAREADVDVVAQPGQQWEVNVTQAAKD